MNSDQILANRYRLILLVGQGAMGAVYDAEDLVFNRRVALKRMHLPPEASPKAIEQTRAQFEREAKILATLRHPNLPRVTDYFTFSDQEFLVMDYIEGLSLDEIAALHSGGLDEAAVLGWADQLLSALDYIHRHGLVHRDVKPANIRVTPEGHVFLVDFGLVKTFDPASPKTATAVRGLGTPQYAPPEQYDAEMGHTEPRSDLYSLGATMYHLITGEPPATVTRRVSNPGVFRSLREIKPTVSPEVERVILRAMEVPITKRFASASDMQAALRLAHTQTQADPTGTSHLPATELIRAHRTNRRRTLRTVAGLLALLGVCATAVVVAAPGLVATPTPTAATSTATSSVPAALPANTVTNAPTATPTVMPATNTATATVTPSATASATNSATPTPSPSATRRRTPTQTPTSTPAPTDTPKNPPQPSAPPPTQPPRDTAVPPTEPRPTPGI